MPYLPPPSRWELLPGEAHLCLVSLTGSPARLVDFAGYLAPEERARASRFRTRELKDAYIFAHGVLRAILGGCLNQAPSAVPLAYGESGKPGLTGSRLRFNLSHAGGTALYAISRDLELGVDIEPVRPMSDLEAIARRFFCNAETTDLLSLPRGQRDRGFFHCWTRKEAYVKATGEGLGRALDSFRVSLLPGEAPRLEAPADLRVWSIFDVSPGPEIAAALVTEGHAPKVRAWQMGNAGECADYFISASQLPATGR